MKTNKVRKNTIIPFEFLDLFRILISWNREVLTLMSNEWFKDLISQNVEGRINNTHNELIQLGVKEDRGSKTENRLVIIVN
jgi:hypothetical protein